MNDVDAIDIKDAAGTLVFIKLSPAVGGVVSNKSMIISDTEKFVFIHNPKAGGMTFRLALAPCDTRNNMFFEWQFIADSELQLDMAHITPDQLRIFFPDTLSQVRDYLKFGFVRNPYDRYLSAVSQHLKLCTPYVRNTLLEQPDLFYKFASHMTQHVLNDSDIEQDHRLVHFRRQIDFFSCEGSLWADRIFKLEETALIDDPQVLRWLGAAFLTNSNRTEQFADSGYHVSQLDPVAIDRINEFYTADFERLSYSMAR